MIQQVWEPSWLPEDSDHWNSIYMLNNEMVFFWAEDGPDNGDGLGRSGLFVFPTACFTQSSAGKGGYFIDLDKPGWKLRVKELQKGRVVSGVERVFW